MTDVHEARERPSARVMIFLIALCGVSMATTWPRLSAFANEWDCANYVMAMRRYDILQHTPHPPGYFAYVMAGRVLSWVCGSAHLALTVVSMLMTAASVFPIYFLARRCFSHRVASWSAVLALSNPVALLYSCIALSGICALFFAPLVLWLLVRGVQDRDRSRGSLLIASFALGVAGGFRQDLVVFFIPVWVLALVLARGGIKQWGLSVLMLLLGVALWVVPMLISIGGLAPYLESHQFIQVLLERDALAYNASMERVLANAVRLLAAVTSSLGAAGVIGLALLLVPARQRQIMAGARDRRVLLLLVVSVLPALAYFMGFYLHRSSYILPILPSLLILGVAALCHATRGRRFADMTLSASALLGVACYFFVPAFDDLARGDNGYDVQHRAMSRGMRIARHWLRLTHGTVSGHDSRSAEVQSRFAKFEAEYGAHGFAVVVLSGNRYDWRMAMTYAPHLLVYELLPPAAGAASGSVRIGRDSRFESIAGSVLSWPTSVGKIVWLVTGHQAESEALQAQGGELIRGERSVLVVTEPTGVALWGVTFGP